MKGKLSEALRTDIESYLEAYYIDPFEVVCLEIPLMEKDLTVGSFAEEDSIPLSAKYT